jgi:hypothetical protein
MGPFQQPARRSAAAFCQGLRRAASTCSRPTRIPRRWKHTPYTASRSRRRVLRDRLPREGLEGLLGRPLGGWVCGHAGPVLSKPLALPSDHGRRLHENQDVPPASPMPRQPRPEDSVSAPHPRPPDRSVVDRELMPTRHDLHLGGHARPEEARNEREQGTDDGRQDAGSFRRRGEYSRRVARCRSREGSAGLRITSIREPQEPGALPYLLHPGPALFDP